MAFVLRSVEPEADFPRVAELLNQVGSELVTAAMLHESESRRLPGQIRRRVVAVNEDGVIAGYSVVRHAPHMQAGRFYLWVVVDRAWRNRGIGGRLYDDALDFALSQGATLLDSDVREEHPESLHFAERHGFIIDRHMFESVIDLRSFDESRFDGLSELVESSGIRFFSLAEAGNTPEAQRKLYEVNRATSLDDPASHGTFPDFDEFSLNVFQASWFRPEGQILAADGDRYVGLAAVGYIEEDNSMYNMMTGVIEPYRGRRIAQALKVSAIRFAKTYGADFIRTHNDSQNAPMLAINRKLGYEPRPGEYRVIKRL